MSRLMTKPTKWHVRPLKTPISLGICPVWSVSSLPSWRKLGSLAIHWVHIRLCGCPGWSESSLDAQSFCWFCRGAAHMLKFCFFSIKHQKLTRRWPPWPPADETGQHVDSRGGGGARERGWVIGGSQCHRRSIGRATRQCNRALRLQGKVGTNQTNISHRIGKIWTGKRNVILVWWSYRNDPKFSDRSAWTNSADPSDQSLHCLQFCLHLLDEKDALHYGKAILFKF